MADLVIGVGADTDEAAAGFRSMGDEVMHFAEKIAALTKEFRENEKAQAQVDSALKQLGYEVETLSPALRSQAEAFQANLGVSKDMIAHMQSLMLTFGTAPEDINKTTKAILDYAERTGQDAEAATLKLEKAIDNGGKGLQKMGIHFVETGDKAKDLAQVVDQLEGKMGGAAAAAADTLDGRLNKLEFGVSDLKEAFGGFLADVDARYHIIDNLTTALRAAAQVLTFGDNREDTAQHIFDLQKQLVDKKKEELQLEADVARGMTPASSGYRLEQKKKEIEDLNTALAAATESMHKFTDADRDLTGEKSTANTGYETSAKKKAREKEEKETEDFHKKALEEEIRYNDKAAAWAIKDETAKDEAIVKASEAREDALHAQDEQAAADEKAILEGRTQAYLDTVKSKLNAEHMAGEAMIAASKVTHAQLTAEEITFRSTMAQIGEQATALAAGQLLELAIEGKESWMKQASAFLSSVAVQATVSAAVELARAIAASASLVTAAEAPGHFYAAAQWGAVAALAGGGAIGLGAAGGGSGANEKHHDGGWANDERPRYHTGGFVEVPATLLAGERVLSHAEIERMGGAGAVDAAARGGSGPLIGSVTVQAFDAVAVRDLFTDQGGRGLSHALRTGRGYLPRLFGRR